jgi:hypothetical protein
MARLQEILKEMFKAFRQFAWDVACLSCTPLIFNIPDC